MKKGISLIVLVITIIVMIILAASVVVSLSNTGIINKAGEAVNLTDERQVQDMASLIWTECYLEPDKKNDIVNIVKTELGKQGITEDKWNIIVSNTGVEVTSKNNTSVEKIVFTYLGKEYVVDKGTIWYDFIWNSEWDEVRYENIMNPEDTEGNVYAPSGLKIINEDTEEYIYLNEEIIAGIYLVDVPDGMFN